MQIINIKNSKKMKKIIVILLLFLGYNSSAQHNQPALPNLYIDFQLNTGVEYMSKINLNSGETIFIFRSLLLGDAPDLTDGVALQLTQIEGTTPVTIPLANLATYMAGRPLQTTIQIRQECLIQANNPVYNYYFDELHRDMYVVERNTTTQTAKITKVFCSNDFE